MNIAIEKNTQTILSCEYVPSVKELKEMIEDFRNYFKDEVDIEITNEVLEMIANDKITNYIYKQYPRSKQDSDRADYVYFKNLLKIKKDKNGNKIYPDLEETVISKVIAFFEKNKTIEELVADVAQEDQYAFEQLIKVSIRVTWVQRCKEELKKSIAEDREPNFPKYPLD